MGSGRSGGECENDRRAREGLQDSPAERQRRAVIELFTRQFAHGMALVWRISPDLTRHYPT